MKTYGGVDVYTHIILTVELVRGERSASSPGCFTLGIHWLGSWVGPRVGMDDVEKGKFLTLRGLELCPSVVQPVAISYTDWAIPDPTLSTIYVKYLISPNILKCVLWMKYVQIRKLQMHQN
jgi:hypothetical protein